jgi:hypothetical protein
MDGSTVYLLNREDIIEHFGTHKHPGGKIAMAMAMQLHDVLNNITVWADIYPNNKSEKAVAAEQVSRLAKDSLTLFDRGYPSYGLMYLMINEEEPRHFIICCPVTFNKEVIQFARSGKRSKVVILYPNYKSMAMLKENGYIVTNDTGIKVRMVQVNLPNGEQEILLTNLYDEDLYSVGDLKYLYGLRWGIETSYNKQKNQQQMEQFSGIRVICIQQDYAAGIFVANLQSLLEKQSVSYLRSINEKRKYNYQINRNISFASLKYNIICLFLEQDPLAILLKLQKKFEAHLEPVRPGRLYDRSRKAKRHTGKYQTFTNYKRAV